MYALYKLIQKLSGNGSSPSKISISNVTNGGCNQPSFAGLSSLAFSDCQDSYYDNMKILSLGDYGCDVVWLQQSLNDIQPSNPLIVDGKFGCNTQDKLKLVSGLNQASLNDIGVPPSNCAMNYQGAESNVLLNTTINTDVALTGQGTVLASNLFSMP